MLAWYHFHPYYDVSVVPAGGERGVVGRALALAESGYVNLPTPELFLLFIVMA